MCGCDYGVRTLEICPSDLFVAFYQVRDAFWEFVGAEPMFLIGGGNVCRF